MQPEQPYECPTCGPVSGFCRLHRCEAYPAQPPAAWDGRPDNPDRDGWHWLRFKSDGCSPFAAEPVCRYWIAGQWLHIGSDTCTPEGAAWRCEYLGPCLQPNEIARLRTALREIAASDFEPGDWMAKVASEALAHV